MKIAGRTIEGPNESFLPLPRSSGNIILKFRAITDTDEFDKILPLPVPPTIKYANNSTGQDIKDEKYLKLMADRAGKRVAWTVIKTLEPTEIEWDTVKISDPETWDNYIQDFKKAGISDAELTRIVNEVLSVNSLSDVAIEKARADFLAGQVVQEK